MKPIVVTLAARSSDWRAPARAQDAGGLVIARAAARPSRVAPAEEIRSGDVLCIEANERHRHGASPTTAMHHIAVVESLDGSAVDRMEHVADARHGAEPHAR